MKNKTRFWQSRTLLFFFCCALSGTLFGEGAMDIDQVTGPIALYPDALIFQVLPASKDVETVLKFNAWVKENAHLKGTELQDAAEGAGFAQPYVALAPFPEVIQMMAEKADWTKLLGQV